MGVPLFITLALRLLLAILLSTSVIFIDTGLKAGFGHPQNPLNISCAFLFRSYECTGFVNRNQIAITGSIRPLSAVERQNGVVRWTMEMISFIARVRSWCW
ncbi:hypothetical protein F4801DRAFT_555480 [Xylaria longipes]|nr:hypothetical protein F4801DRAFT_555480 [Xylaria longipes]